MEASARGPETALFSLPADPIAGVFQAHTERLEGGSNSVRGGEILPLPGVFAQSDDKVEKTVHDRGVFLAVFEEPEDPADSPEDMGGLVERGSTGTDLDRLVDGTGVLEQGRDRLPRVEVV